MKKSLLFKSIRLAFILLSVPMLCFAEETKNEAATKPFAKIFSWWALDLQDGASPQSQFELSRVYFGAKHQLNENAAIKVTLDAGRIKPATSVSVDSTFSASVKKDASLVMYVKTAQLDWKNLLPMVSLTTGLHGLKQFKAQESFWGYRYIYKSFMDQHKYGSSADLGLTATVKPVDQAKIYATLINGEGYKKLQGDDNYKSALGLELSPIKSLVIFLYGDIMPTDKEAQTTAAAFVGYKFQDMFRIGAEFNYQIANGGVKDKDLQGVSAYAAYIINKYFEVFGRFDMAASKDDANIANDGNLILAGVQAHPFKGFKLAANYQGFTPASSGADLKPLLAVNTELNF